MFCCVFNDEDGRMTFNRSHGLNFWLINNSWHKHTATTVMPCSLHSTAKVTYIITSNSLSHLVWWGGRFRLDLANVKSANRYQIDANSSALPTIPVTASVWIWMRIKRWLIELNVVKVLCHVIYCSASCLTQCFCYHY